jgi:prepilin-type N-terminal cleavage/methylation domain-containing protein
MERFWTRDKKGFTLVELALVLVIIGLLITGILKGEALIRNAKVKNVVNQKNTLTAAFYTYYDRFQYYPGDAPTPAGDNIPTQGTKDAGNNNGRIDTAAEQLNLFRDLSLAQIINGGYTGVAGSVPQNTFGGTATIQWYANMNQNCVVFQNVPANVAQEIDTKYDNGSGIAGAGFSSGTIRTNADYVNNNGNVTLYWGMSAQ